MCATCVAQGAVYVGGALTGLQVMAARARARRRGGAPGAADAPAAPEDQGDRPAGDPVTRPSRAIADSGVSEPVAGVGIS